MIIRIRSSQGTIRLCAEPNDTIHRLVCMLPPELQSCTLSNDPNNSSPSLPSTATLSKCGIKQGHLLYAIPTKPKIQNELLREQQKLSQIDKLLQSDQGLIVRSRDSVFCRHGQNAMCDYCSPLEVLKYRKFCYLSSY